MPRCRSGVCNEGKLGMSQDPCLLRLSSSCLWQIQPRADDDNPDFTPHYVPGTTLPVFCILTHLTLTEVRRGSYSPNFINKKIDGQKDWFHSPSLIDRGRLCECGPPAPGPVPCTRVLFPGHYPGPLAARPSPGLCPRCPGFFLSLFVCWHSFILMQGK